MSDPVPRVAHRAFFPAGRRGFDTYVADRTGSQRDLARGIGGWTRDLVHCFSVMSRNGVIARDPGGGSPDARVPRQAERARPGVWTTTTPSAKFGIEAGENAGGTAMKAQGQPGRETTTGRERPRRRPTREQ